MLQKHPAAARVDDRFGRLDHLLDPRSENQLWNPLTCTVKIELTPTDIANPVEQANSKRFSMQLRPEAHTCTRPNRTSIPGTRPSTLQTVTPGA
jgi:hypothetical protein